MANLLEKHLVRLVTNEPFYSSISRSINKIPSVDIPTATVHVKQGEFFLTWNPEYVIKLIDDQIQELLKHEFLHLILGHCTSRIRFLNKSPRVWFWAADLAINCLLNAEHLPPGGILPGKFPSIPKEYRHLYSSDFLERHEKLVKAMRALPSLKSADWYFKKLSKDPDVVQAIEENSKKKNNHELWEKMTDEDRKLGQRKVEKLFNKAVEGANNEFGGWGTVPYSARRLLEQMVCREVSWGNLLRYFCGISRSANRSRTFKRISRRHHLFPGLKRQRTGKIVVPVDMSTSVSDALIAQVFDVLGGLAEHIEFTVVPFDHAVAEDQVFIWERGKKISPKRLRYGGTNFDAPTKWVNEHRDEFDAAIFITDGLAQEPTQCLIRRCWMLVPFSSLLFKTDEMVIRMSG